MRYKHSSAAFAKAFAYLASRIGQEDASRELRWMKQAALATSTLTATPVPHHVIRRKLMHMISRRARHEPLQYILGNTPFGPLELKTRKPVLIPRPETEYWTTKLAERLLNSYKDVKLSGESRSFDILDLCTGSACIPLLLCSTLPPGSARALGIDISQEACQLARENAALLNMNPSNQEDRSKNTVDILQLDIFNHPERLCFKKYNVITCNPPYIPYNDFLDLPSSVKSFEDSRALMGDPLFLYYTQHSPSHATHQPQLDPEHTFSQGLSFYYLLVDFLLPHILSPNHGLVAVEVGKGQATQVKSLFETSNLFKQIEVWKDPWGIERSIIGVT